MYMYLTEKIQQKLVYDENYSEPLECQIKPMDIFIVNPIPNNFDYKKPKKKVFGKHFGKSILETSIPPNFSRNILSFDLSSANALILSQTTNYYRLFQIERLYRRQLLN